MPRSPCTHALGPTLVALFGIAACSEPSGFAAAPGGPSFDFLENTDNGNPRILRIGSTGGWLLVDAEHNLFSVQAGTNRQFGCHSADVFDVISMQHLLSNPDDPAARAMMAPGLGEDVYLAVYRGPFPFANCADLMSRKIAEGTGRFVITDNDLAPLDRVNHNHNAFGFTAHGTLDRVDGAGTVHYNGVSKCEWDGEDLASLKCMDKINLQ